MCRIKMLYSCKKDHSIQNFCKGNGSSGLNRFYRYLHMLLLLVSATEFEISETIDWLNTRNLTHNAQNPELLITGIGQLQAAYALGKKIMEQRPHLVIQAGIG